jgi:hypothetical protein
MEIVAGATLILQNLFVKSLHPKKVLSTLKNGVPLNIFFL